MHVLVQALLEHTSAQVVSLPLHDLTKRRNQRRITDARLTRRLAEPGRLERLASKIFLAGRSVAPSPTFITNSHWQDLDDDPDAESATVRTPRD